jgi:isopentenyl-diphosphate delta-isomerase
VLYSAPSNDIWGEHEIDYILMVKKDVSLDKVNANEVMSCKWVSQQGLRDFIKSSSSISQCDNNNETGVKISPWFKIICDNFLYDWWNSLDNLDKCKDWENIHAFKVSENDGTAKVTLIKTRD